MVVGWSGHLVIIFRSTQGGGELYQLCYQNWILGGFVELFLGGWMLSKYQVIFVTNGCT